MRLTLIRPDDWHLHLRDGDVLSAVLPHTARLFARAVVMPNLTPPVTTTAQALAYRERILAALPGDSDFKPLMTLYLTDTTTPAEIERARSSGHVHAAKLYPAGATTNSDHGVTDLERVLPALQALVACDMPLLVHGEVTEPEVDVFDREAVFIDRHLRPLLDRQPDLKVVLEHVTTRQGVEFVSTAPDTVAGTLTAHHLLWNRNAIFTDGLNPHAYCLPVLKREEHRQALLAAATGGSRRFFLGTDSAPHLRSTKESACGCAGIYSAHAAVELYAQAFEQAGALDRFEEFASLNGPAFYGLEPNIDRITLESRSWQVPESYPCGDDSFVPMAAGSELSWQVVASPV